MNNLTKAEKATITRAINIIAKQQLTTGYITSSGDAVKRFQLELGLEEREVFAVMFMTSQHQVIEFDRISMGTVNCASVYPREVIKRALELNAAAIILGHNHPSGVIEPSDADTAITGKIAEAAELVGVRVLDHVIVGPTQDYVSFASKGFI